MKKQFIGIFAVVIAICLVSFTSSKFTNYYWFPADESEVLQPISSSVQPVASNPFSCPTGTDVLCTKAFLPLQTETFTIGTEEFRKPKDSEINNQQQLVRKAE